MCDDRRLRRGWALCALAAMAFALPASAAVMVDFTLSSAIDLGDDPQPQVIFSLIQVNPLPTLDDPALAGVDVNFLVSYGTIGTFTGMFFEFINQSVAPNEDSVVTSILFQTDGLLPTPNYSDWSGTQVAYTIGENAPDGGFSIDFNDDLNLNPESPPPANGLGTGEHLLIGYTIDSGHTYQSLLEDLFIGGPDDYNGWTIAAHLQETTGLDGSTGGSIWLASYANGGDPPFPPEVVPIPGAAGLGLLGMVLVALRCRMKGGAPT